MEISELISELRQDIMQDESILADKKAALKILEGTGSGYSSLGGTKRGRPAGVAVKKTVPTPKVTTRPGWSPERRAKMTKLLADRKSARLAKVSVRVQKQAQVQAASTPKQAEPASTEAPASSRKATQAKKDLISAIKSVKPTRPAAKRPVKKKAAKKAIKGDKAK